MRRRQRVRAPTCARCGRSLTNEATMTPVGPVGPECAAKLAGLERFLMHFGLDELMNGPIVVAAQRAVNAEGHDLWHKPDGLMRLEHLARRAGLELRQQVDWSADPPLITAELRVSTSPHRRRAFLRSYAESQRAFERRLRQAAKERRVA